MMSLKINRRVLRERALQILYAFEMNGEDLSRITDEVLVDVEDATKKDFTNTIVNSAIAHRDELDEYIHNKVENWEINRIAVIDKILLRMGIVELLYLPDVPPKVTINEVIEIAKTYSTINSGKFINGILDSILHDLRNSGRLNKTGRGLVEESFRKKTFIPRYNQ